MKKIISILLLLSTMELNAQTAPPSYVPLIGLEAWLPFDSHFNDISGNNNHATNYGTVFTEDRCQNADNALYFDGNFKKLIINNAILPDTPSSYSISFWVKRIPELNNKVEIINDRGTHSWNYKYRILLSSNNSSSPQDFSHLLISYIDPYSTEGIYAHEPETTAWEHVVMVYDKDLQQQYIYSNGMQIANRNVVAERYPQHSNATYIGYSTVPTGGNNEDNPFKGSLDDIGFWSRALDIKEIIALYRGSCTSTDTSTGTSIGNRLYDNEKLAVYPNPATQFLNIENRNFNNEPYTIKIINNQGQEVSKKLLDKKIETIQIDKNIARGIHFIYLINNRNQILSVKEIVIE